MIWMIYNVTTIFIFLCIFLDLTWRWWKRKYSSFPSAPNLPWIGIYPFVFFKDSKSIFEQRKVFMKRFDHIYINWLLWKPLLTFARAEFIEAMIKSREPITKNNYGILKELLGDGLVVSTGEKWKKRRHAFNSAFNFSILHDFVDIFEKHALNLVKKLKIIGRDNNAVDIQKLMRFVMLDVICESSMGVNINTLDSPESDYSKSNALIRSMFHSLNNNPLYRNKKIFQLTKKGKAYYNALNIVQNFSINVINENLAKRKEKMENPDNSDDSDSKKRVFIDILLDLYDKGEIDAEGIHEEVETFMAAGHDTTATSFSWLMYELGRRPEIQRRVQAEVDEISKMDCSLMDKLRMLDYTESVIKESMRYNPAVHRFSREINKDLIVKDVFIPAGTTTVIDIYGVHHNPEYWEDPHIFKPERFKKDVKVSPYCFIPFSSGPRNCIGQKFAMLELKVFTFMIMSSFTVKSIQSPDELDIAAYVVLFSKNGIQVQFTPR